MKNISKNKLVFIALLVVSAIIVMAWLTPVQRIAGVHIVSEASISQGSAENNSEMESVKVHGIFWNEGDIIARNLTAVVIFTDPAHDKVVRKNVPVGGDLLANKGQFMEFDSEYLRERTIPKTVVNVTVKFDWKENGEFKTSETSLSSVKTVRPADTFCTEVIVPFQEVISLDVYGLKAGIYTVNVNGLNGTFELVTDNSIQE